MADDWRSPNFRNSIVQRIGQTMSQGNLLSATNTRTNPQNLESHIFSKSSSKEEYLSYAQKLVTHFRNQIAQNQLAQNKQMQQQHKQEVEMGGGGGGPQSMIPDPINALQNLASQGSRPVNTGQIPVVPVNQMQQGVPMQGGPNNINASNLLQTLNQQRPGQQPQPNQQMRGQVGGQPMMNVGPNQISMGNMNMMAQQQQQQPNQMQMQNQMGGGGMNQMQMNQMNMNQMNPIMGNRMGNQPNMNVGPVIPNQIQMQGNIGNLPNNQGPGMMSNTGIVPQGPQGGNNMQQMINMQQKQQANMGIPQQGNMYRVNPNAGQNFLPQSPSQNVASPAQQMPSQPPQIPNPQMIPSPALVPASSPQMPIMSGGQRVLMQSPSQPLNTPGQPVQSPYNAQEDIIYREKYKQLTKYIDPLQKMIAKMSDDSEKIGKMNRLLEILLNPQQRIPLETLLKCEKALERMDILHIAPSNKHYFLETVNTVLQTATGHHTLYRTFHPSFESLFGTDIQLSSPAPKKRSAPVEETQETPHVLQGEIARLDQKFKVTLDPATQNQTKTLTLNCCLDDKCLPWVPPICVTIPENYPFISPTCTLNKQEYTATPFLTSVEKSLASRIGKLPKLHSLSHILDTWEMSVRQACSPSSAAMTADDVLADILAF